MVNRRSHWIAQYCTQQLARGAVDAAVRRSNILNEIEAHRSIGKMSPLITFIIPMYNASSFIEKCVLSIVGQSIHLNQIEIFLYNDGSTDNTLEVSQKIQSLYQSIKIISQSNQGVSATRNAAIEVAQGEYLWFLDSDDYLIPEVAQVIFAQAANSQLDIITFDYKTVSADEVVESPVVLNTTLGKIQTGAEYIARVNYPNYCWNYIFKRKLVASSGLRFNPLSRYWEDVLFTTELFLSSRTIAHLSLAVVAHVHSPGSLSKKGDIERELKHIENFFITMRGFDPLVSGETRFGKLPPATLQRIKSRQQSFVFFLCLRLWRKVLPLQKAHEIYETLLQENRIPFRDFSFEEYKGLRYPILRAIINTPWLFKLLMRVIRWF
jgi:glycosyltransferase involved in cell wall biosynthesis